MNRKQLKQWRGMGLHIVLWGIVLGALTTTVSAQILTGTVISATAQKPAVAGASC